MAPLAILIPAASIKQEKIGFAVCPTFFFFPLVNNLECYVIASLPMNVGISFGKKS